MTQLMARRTYIRFLNLTSYINCDRASHGGDDFLQVCMHDDLMLKQKGKVTDLSLKQICQDARISSNNIGLERVPIVL